MPSDPRRDRAAGLSRHGRRLLSEVAPAIQRKEFASAESGLRALVALAPDHPEVLRMQALVHYSQRRFRDAADLLERARAQWPDDALIVNNLGSALGEAGDVDASLSALRRSTELAPNTVTAWFNLGVALDIYGRVTEAHAALTRALECDVDHVKARATLARQLQMMGRIDEAIAEYREALRRDPASVTAWYGLSTVRTSRFDETDLKALCALYGQASLKSADRIYTGFALAKALEDHGRPAEAFAVLTVANASRRREVKWNARQFSHHIDTIVDAFSRPVKRAADADLGREVIFIVSMPRSGSTLVEQIFAAHPEVEGANELTDLPVTLNEESTRRHQDFEQWAPRASAADWERLGRRYLERTAQWRERRARFTDKGLSNWRYLGSALSMLPGARFISVQRDAVETCLSCYRQLFANEQGYTYDLAELAAFRHDYERLMSLWRDRYPNQLYELSYEQLVADPEAEIRKLLAFCGLPFDAACLRFHEAERAVRTASAAQVREPLRSDTARAARYGALLNTLRRTLGVAP